MATAQTEISKIETTIGVWLDTKHVIMLVLILGLSLFVVYSYASKRADKAEALAAVAEQKSQIEDQTNAIYQKQVTDQINSLNQQNIQLSQQVSSLSDSIAERNRVLSNTQASAPSLSPSQLSNDWETLISVPNSVSYQSSGNYQVSVPASIKTVQELESVPVLKQDVSDESAQNTEIKKELSNESSSLQVETEAHAKDNTACITDKQTLTTKLNAANARNLKGKIKAFFIGVAVGFIGGLVK